MESNNIDQETLEEISYILYSIGIKYERKGGASLVEGLAHSINEHYVYDDEPPIKWDYCEFCDRDTPRFKKSPCLNCGQ